MARYSNPWLKDDVHSLATVLRWKFGRGPKDPVTGAPDTPPEVLRLEPLPPPADHWRVTWLGHSSFLLQGCGRTLLVDPVFSEFCAPFPVKSLRRMVPPPCTLQELPPVDAVLLTHSHYDHLDLDTLRQLGTQMPLVVPHGHSRWLRGKGFQSVQETGWYETAEILPGIRVTGTPAQHFTARTPFDRNRGHWCGWRISGGGTSLWHTGDTGYCPAFREIGDRLGPVDLGLIPIGAYSPRWFMRAMHVNPEEAVKIFQETLCHRAVAMHWGTFRLTDEPVGEPPLKLREALQEAGIAPHRFVAGRVGESWEVFSSRPAEVQG